MMNPKVYSYHIYEAPNILGEFPKMQTPVSGVSILEILHAPITILAKKHPEWKFVSSSHSASSSPGFYVARAFKVYQGDYLLGTIKYEYRGQEPAIGIDNERLRRTRERDNCTKTKDAKKAVSIVEKNFFAPTTPELANVARSAASAVVDKNAYEARRRYIDLMGSAPKATVLGKLATVIMSDPYTHHDMLVHAGVTKDVLDVLPSLHTAFVDAEALRLVKDHGGGSVVLIKDQDYVVTNANPAADMVGNIKVFSTDTLPPAFKRSLGMLKLLEVGCYIASVGARTAEDTFFVNGFPL